MKHTIRPAARDDILRQFHYYLVNQDRPEVANRFVEAVDRTVEKILRTPNAGAPKQLSNLSLAGLRSWPVDEFEKFFTAQINNDHTRKAYLNVTRTTLSELVNGKRGISPEMAVRLSKVFGGNAESWLVTAGAVRPCPGPHGAD